MIQRHTVYNGPVREWVPGSPRPAPVERRRCDKGCGTILRSTNPYGRCQPCCERHGWPELDAPPERDDADRTPTVRRPRGPHKHCPECRCPELAWKDTRPDHSARWVVNVTCPDCGDVRISRISGGRANQAVCKRGYKVRCVRCTTVHANQVGRDSYRRQD